MFSEKAPQTNMSSSRALAALRHSFETVEIDGVPIHAVSMDDAVASADEAIQKRWSLTFGMVNMAKLVNARYDQELRQSLLDADLVLADGMPVVWLSRLCGRALPERVPGIDLMYRLLELADERAYRIFLLGATEAVNRAVAGDIQERYSGSHMVGRHHGYFSADQAEGIASMVRASSADLLFVAMSPPKKELFLKQWSRHMGVPVCHGVGGSLDVFAGLTRRAPCWMQRCGLEWLYRIYQEPLRLWNRYAITNTMAIGLFARALSHRIMKRRRKQ